MQNLCKKSNNFIILFWSFPRFVPSMVLFVVFRRFCTVFGFSEYTVLSEPIEKRTVMKPVFVGACTALITPFRDGKIDYKALDALIEYQIENGISALLFSGTTGESAVLTYREHQNLLRHAVRRINGRVPVIAGTGSNDTRKAVRMTRYACEYGADAVLAVTPYYNKATQEGLIVHYRAVADASEKPVILYHVPGRTAVTMKPETIHEISLHPKIGGIKEASTDLASIALTASLCPNTPLYCGNDDLLLPLLSLGACGVISVMSNIFPAVSSRICSLYSSGKLTEALALYRRYLPFARALFCEVNPIPVKAILSYAGFCENELRLPLTPAKESTVNALCALYRTLI